MSKFSAEQAIANAAELLSQRYIGAEFCLAAGSIVHGQAGEHSDLDLVVLFRELKCAFRESFRYRLMPVEAFVHDYETIQAFMDRDYKNAHSAIIHMMATGKVVGAETEISRRLQDYACALFDGGPEQTPEAKSKALRYSVSELLEDLRDDREPHEVRAILYSLYETIGELRLRQSRAYIGTGKHLARVLWACDPAFAETLDGVMIAGHAGRFSSEHFAQFVALLDTLGGELFDGYRQDAPMEMREKAPWSLSADNSV